MRELGTDGPAKAVCGEGCEGEGTALGAQVEAGEDRRVASEAIAEVPILIAQVGAERVAIFGAALEGAGIFGGNASFLCVPAEERGEVDGFAMEVVVLGRYALEGKLAQEEEESFE